MEKTIPYKDTYLTFYNYKEPLKKADTGFGYQGVLLGTVDGKQVQCHLCGELFGSVATHIRQSHLDEVAGVHEYKERFQLAYSTALISETERFRLKEITLNWWRSRTPEQWAEMRRKSLKGYRDWQTRKSHHKQPKGQLETKNKRGTCPDQLLEKIRKCSEEIYHVPTKADFIKWDDGSQRYVHLIYATFGSWTKAIEQADLSAERVMRDEKTIQKRHYSDEELLDMLSLFNDEHGRLPSASDCRRGLLPDYDIFARRFGSFPKARLAAGIKERPTRFGTKPA